jgi:hypothetical protein
MARSNLPAVGSPNTSVVERDDKGQVIRRRFYGGDGKAVKNIDYDHGAGKPHAHDWDWTKDPPRQPGRPLKPGE